MEGKTPKTKNLIPQMPEPTAYLWAADERLRQQAKSADEFTPEEMRKFRVDLVMALMPASSTISREDIEEVINSGRG